MSADESLRAELEGWSAEVQLARSAYRMSPTVTYANAADTPLGESVPRDTYMVMVRANGRLAKELREARAALEEARRTIAIAKMRGKPPR